MYGLFCVLALFASGCPVDVEVTCEEQPWKVRSDWVHAADDTDELVVSGIADVAARLPTVKLGWSIPASGVTTRWAEFWWPHVEGTYRTSFACWTPIWGFRGPADENRGLYACSDAKSHVSFDSHVDEFKCEHRCEVVWTGSAAATQTQFSVRFRFDERRLPGYQAVVEASKWIDRTSGYVPMKAPASAFLPVYSTWYAFHRDVTAEKVENAATEAMKLGMKAIIVDDGWQVEDADSLYEHCGEWVPAASRFPDMKTHVDRVHKLGMKYVLWYAAPFMGCKCPLYEKFKHTFMGTSFNGRVGVMDPRYPEVREHIIGVLEHAVREWGVDGFKVDFIGRYTLSGTLPKEGYDGRGLEDGVEALMSGIATRLKALNPDIMIEFRQEYVGNAIIQYGNMLRCSDCCCMTRCNRNGIASMRLTAPSSAIHSDMLAFNPQEKPEDSARSVLDSLFGVIQYSPDFSRITDGQRRMIGHWVRFSKDHEESLLHGKFRPYGAPYNYNAIEGEGSNETVRIVYQTGIVTEAGACKKPMFLLNATGVRCLCVSVDVPVRVRIFNTYGEEGGTLDWAAGLGRLPIPVGGYAIVERTKGKDTGDVE